MRQCSLLILRGNCECDFLWDSFIQWRHVIWAGPMLARLIKKFFRKSRLSNCEQLFLVFFPQLFPSNWQQLFLALRRLCQQPVCHSRFQLALFCNKILPPVPDIQYSCKAMWGQPCGKGTQAWSNPFLLEFCVLDLAVLFVLKLSSFSTDIWFSASLNKLCNRSFIPRTLTYMQLWFDFDGT